jgi:hypothetical protein
MDINSKKQDRRAGQAALETVLIILPLFAVLMAILDFSVAIFVMDTFPSELRFHRASGRYDPAGSKRQFVGVLKRQDQSSGFPTSDQLLQAGPHNQHLGLGGYRRQQQRGWKSDKSRRIGLFVALDGVW